MSNHPSIRNFPVFTPKISSRPVTMEDVRIAKLGVLQILEHRGITFATEDDREQFWDSLGLFLEESFNWPDYSSYN